MNCKKNRTIKVSEFIKTGVYFLLKEGKIVYIGTTTRYPLRFFAHRDKKDFDAVRFIEYPESLCYRAELRLIKYFKPLYNKTGKPNPSAKRKETKSKYNFPKESGTVSTINYSNYRELYLYRSSLCGFSRRANIKYRTSANNGVLMVTVL
jgi:hypothetical protein